MKLEKKNSGYLLDLSAKELINIAGAALVVREQWNRIDHDAINLDRKIIDQLQELLGAAAVH